MYFTWNGFEVSQVWRIVILRQLPRTADWYPGPIKPCSFDKWSLCGGFKIQRTGGKYRAIPRYTDPVKTSPPFLGFWGLSISGVYGPYHLGQEPEKFLDGWAYLTVPHIIFHVMSETCEPDLSPLRPVIKAMRTREWQHSLTPCSVGRRPFLWWLYNG